MDSRTRPLSPHQCKAARALLAITQVDLARAAGLSPRTVKGFESGELIPKPSTLELLAGALELAGVDLLFEPPGVRLKPDDLHRGG